MIIGILAAIIIVAFNGVMNRALTVTIQSDLRNSAQIMDVSRVSASDNAYPISLPTTVKPSNGTILQLASTGNTDSFCINAYAKSGDTSSYDSSSQSIRSYLCNGATIGTAVGGTVPLASRNVNLVPNFSAWTLNTTATYDGTTLTLGPSGVATSPLIRVDSPTSIAIGGDYYASIASNNSALAPKGGNHTGISYFGSDGTTPVNNSANYTSNGCARAITLNAWDLQNTQCNYYGGPLVIYVRWYFTGSNGGFASPDLKIKNPLLIIN